MITQNLADALRFTFDDLIANRTGQFSDAQRTRLRLDLLRETVFYGIVALLPFGGLLFLLSNPVNSPLLLLIFALLTVVFVISIVRHFQATRADLAGATLSAAGRVERHAMGRGFYRLRIDQQNFQITAKEYGAFSDGKSYRVYYLPRLRMILSAELIES